MARIRRDHAPPAPQESQSPLHAIDRLRAVAEGPGAGNTADIAVITEQAGPSQVHETPFSARGADWRWRALPVEDDFTSR